MNLTGYLLTVLLYVLSFLWAVAYGRPSADSSKSKTRLHRYLVNGKVEETHYKV